MELADEFERTRGLTDRADLQSAKLIRSRDLRLDRLTGAKGDRHDLCERVSARWTSRGGPVSHV